MSDWLGAIHDPDVVFTDLALAMLGAYLARRLWTQPGERRLRKAGALLMGALASAALWGAIFHAFFPGGTATLSGRVAWTPVAFSIVVAGATMVGLGLRLLLPQLSSRVRRWMVMTYATGFAVVVVSASVIEQSTLMDDSFASIVYFYVPALILLLIAAARQASRSRSSAWQLIVVGLMLSVGAAWLQQARVAIHPVYFDHNAVYHIVQGIAVVFLYLGWRRASGAPSAAGMG
jgi:hypothetical protein